MKVEGGRSSAFSAWLNGVYLGSGEADRERSAAGATLTLPPGALCGGGENVVTVLQDHMGIEMEAGELPIGLQSKRGLEAVKLPRGVVAFSFPALRAANRSEPEVTCKVQGNYRGEHAPDTVRRALNEGGLHAEVNGWHLPGFDASHWPSGAPNSSVAFHRASFDLDAPQDVDLGVSFKFVPKKGKRFRAQLYVNGWQMGKYVNDLGPQTVFPVHGGVVNLRGRNEVGVSVWMLDGDGDGDGWRWDPKSDLELVVSHVTSGEPRDGCELQGLGWNELRG